MKISQIIHYAYNNVPYYKELFDENKIRPEDINNGDDLQIIPPLTKTTVRDRFEDLVSNQYKKFNPILIQTSGSTGTPLSIYLDKNISSAIFAFYWHLWGWTGYKMGDRWATIKDEENRQVIYDGNPFKYSRIMNGLYISSYEIDKEKSIRILNELLKFKPTTLRGYPGSLYEFAKFVRNDPRVNELKINNIVTDSENLEDFQRKYIQEVFNTKVFDSYGHWEHVNLIAECEMQRKHHFMEYNFLEIVDENNNRVDNGESGEMLATGFFNLAFPLIRYKTRDIAIRSNIKCDCGRSHDIIDKIEGRHEDTIITPEGKKIGCMSVAFYYTKGYDYAQVIQNSLNSIDVTLVKNKDFNNGDLKTLEKNIRHRIGNSMKINFKYVEKIERGKNGKYRFAINKMMQNE